MAKSFSILREDVDPTAIENSKLTTDCYYVYLEENRVDLARGSMVPIFDHYYDEGHTVSRIRLAGGNRNPKVMQPEV